MSGSGWDCFCGASFGDAHRFHEHVLRHRPVGDQKPPTRDHFPNIPELYPLDWFGAEQQEQVAQLVAQALYRFAYTWWAAVEDGRATADLARDFLELLSDWYGFTPSEQGHFIEALARWQPGQAS